MKQMLIHFIKNIENHKVYHIIIIFTLAFILMVFNGFYHIQKELISFSNQNRILIAKEIEYTISSWIATRINNLESSVKYMRYDSAFNDEKKLQSFIEIFLQDNHYFDAIQILIPDRYFYVNAIKFNDYQKNPFYVDEKTGINPLKTRWFQETMRDKKTTIYDMTVHGYLLEKTLNICTPIFQGEEVKGVFCGILKANSLLEKVEKLHFPQKASYFISNERGYILTPFSNDHLYREIAKVFIEKIDTHHNSPQKFSIDNDVITVSRFDRFNWYIGVIMDKEIIMKESTQRVTSHALWLLLSFALLFIVINSAHEFLRRRVEDKQKEYEYILSHRSRMSEIGELISGINHQLRQPINATALVVSSTRDLSERNLLDKKTLENNLALCQKSIALMDQTIGIFRNFYRCNEAITEFSLLECIQGVLHVNYIELARNNIVIKIEEASLQGIQVVSIENFIQQILLVLIQNAKEALNALDKPAKTYQKVIYLDVSVGYGRVIIDISDSGVGIPPEAKATLFSEFKISKKAHGTGIGLYFARKLAKEKLFGDLVLKNAYSPTVFSFEFAQYLQKKE